MKNWICSLLLLAPALVLAQQKTTTSKTTPPKTTTTKSASTKTTSTQTRAQSAKALDTVPPAKPANTQPANTAKAAEGGDLMSMLDEEVAKKPETNYTTATFKTTRLINAHSIENLAGGVLDVKISHRFGTLNSGLYNLFGWDEASIRFGLDYGITNWLMVGGGRSSVGKQYDGFMKLKLLRQSTGKRNFPFSLGAFAGMYYMTDSNLWKIPNVTNYTSSKLNYVFQLILARKFSEGFSLQLSPTLVHYNIVPLATDKNDMLSVGIGARQKLSKRVSINVEYYYNIPGYSLKGIQNPLSLGFDIETGGHVFQLIFTNSKGIGENQYITKTTGKWSAGDIHFGFNISRVFTIGGKSRMKK
jgi:hypothetical protein